MELLYLVLIGMIFFGLIFQVLLVWYRRKFHRMTQAKVDIYCQRDKRMFEYTDTKDILGSDNVVAPYHFYRCPKCKKGIYARMRTTDDETVSIMKGDTSIQWEIPAGYKLPEIEYRKEDKVELQGYQPIVDKEPVIPPKGGSGVEPKSG